MSQNREGRSRASWQGCVSYWDGDAFVITDKANPNAWVRSDVTISLESDPSDPETTPAATR